MESASEKPDNSPYFQHAAEIKQPHPMTEPSKIGEGKLPPESSPSPNLPTRLASTPSSSKTFDRIESPLPVFLWRKVGVPPLKGKDDKGEEQATHGRADISRENGAATLRPIPYSTPVRSPAKGKEEEEEEEEERGRAFPRHPAQFPFPRIHGRVPDTTEVRLPPFSRNHP